MPAVRAAWRALPAGSKGRITLSVRAVLERGAAQHAASFFAVTVKAPKRRR